MMMMIIIIFWYELKKHEFLKIPQFDFFLNPLEGFLYVRRRLGKLLTPFHPHNSFSSSFGECGQANGNSKCNFKN